MKKITKKLTVLASSILLASLAGSAAFADDGQRLVRSVSSAPGVTEDPEPEGEHAFIKLMNFYVPSQNAAGDLLPVEYFNIDDVLVKTEEKAKPLVNVYVYGPVIGFDEQEASGFAGHGRRDAFGAISLDDGETWKVTNLSNSAGESSFEVTTPLQDPGESEPSLTTDYPGDVPNVFHAVAGNKVMVAWHSKFCESGNPVWSDEFLRDDVAAYLEIDNTTDFYLTDLFGAAGSQSSTDYTELGVAVVGEVPYSCLWSARGVLREDPAAEGTTEVVWFQAERLTSGARDVNRVETACVAGAGCAVTWQEDPEGVRPGEGEGPGTGWSGATTASKTDIWYSFVEWEDMDIVNDDGNPLPLADNEVGGRPIPYVPMMSAARLSNNDRCEIDAADGYCSSSDETLAYGINDQCVGTVDIPLGPQGNEQPICVVDSNDDGTMNAGDMPNLANTAASRPRLNMQPRDSNGDGVVDDAWVIIVSEEDKGLGRFGFETDQEWALDNLDDTGNVCDPEAGLENCQKADVGKDVFWATFNLGSPATSEGVDVEYSLVENVLVQGAQLNQPEVNWRTGVYYPPMDTADMWDFGDLNFLIFNTEIARRTSMMSQPLSKAQESEGGLVAMPLWKQGIVNQGGPADISTRRFALPPCDTGETATATAAPFLKSNKGKSPNEKVLICHKDEITIEVSINALDAHLAHGDVVMEEGDSCPAEADDCIFDETIANPYDAANMVCARYDGEGNEVPGVMYFTDGSNPYYPDGLCMAAPINLSARTPFECEASGENDGLCPGVSDMECVDDAIFGQLCSSENDPEDSSLYDKVLSWYECPGWNGENVSNDSPTLPGECYTEPDSELIGSNMDDASWYNPLEVSKAHRGFIDGDHVYMIYAWSPNFKLNAVGRDRYELYTRRSFNGGISWTTTPDSFTATDGVTYSGTGNVTCETMRDGDTSQDDNHICTEYSPGDPEQSRNVSQLKSMANTILDPRYTPTIASMPTEGDLEWAIYEPLDGSDGNDPTDVRNPSRNFVVYEDGDNTTVSVGEAEPLNLAYGRAEMFGDNFTVWAETDTDTANIDLCYPNDPHGDPDVDWAVGSGFCNEFDTLEGFNDALSEEASITSSAYGDFLYTVWGQFNVDPEHDNEFIDGDSMFRRVWYLDDYISDTEAWPLPDTQ